MNPLLTPLLVVSLLVAAGPARATADAPAAPAPSATSAAYLAEGEVRKIDPANAKITVKHGEIKNLRMPAMTMVFRVRDPALLNQVKVGDKIRFAAEKSGPAIVITRIEPAP
ncbi:copper-binding protein [Caldimonas brevitalea]|uniref:Copper-binding protein n=1 Tax=Caldimonas brevitalea TaxID=413882 RepID=A0A0G3BJ07_9BURK|nr:copper-binding protein [Caldimonas brevitalea]AKJ29429.1 hypothetical protein AAW51_2738 [Caldimonas brevitalea]